MSTATTKDVQRFYETFNFAEMITAPPQLIQDFLDGEINFIQQYTKPGKAILEVGCGYGRLLKVLSLNAEKVVGIDFSKPLLARAQKELGQYPNVEVVQMRAEHMTFEDGMFDYVLCLDASFGNMPNIELDVLRQMKRVCKPEGELILSVFSEEAKEAQIENYTRIGLSNIQDDGQAINTAEGFYSRRFSEEGLRNLFRQVGLECTIQQVCPINYIATAIKTY